MRFAHFVGVGLLFAGPAALVAQEQTTVGGYGEVHYTNLSGPNTPAVVNFRRFIVYLSHSFNDRWAFRSEAEIEDAKVKGGGAGGEVAIEQAFLDGKVTDGLTLRAGLLLVPVGIINETHEPPTFNGVNRPDFDHDMIPTTWREIGVGAVGTLPGNSGLAYRIYLVNGLSAAGFSADDGIRGGRGEGQEASFDNPSVTGRLEWARPGIKIGTSFWYGGTTAGDTLLGTGGFAAPVLVLSADARYDLGALSLRAVAANIGVKDADLINARYGGDVGSRLTGGYLEAGYNVLAAIAPQASARLNAFVRHERYDSQAAVPAGTTRDLSLNRRLTTLGLVFKPTWNTAFKGDYELVRNAAGVGQYEVLRFGVGYQF